MAPRYGAGMKEHSIQRAAPRLMFDSLAIVRGVGGQVLRTRDVSEHGVFVWSALRPTFGMELGHILDVDVLGKNSGLRCKAVISRVVAPGSREGYLYPHGLALRLIYDDAARVRMRGMLEEVGDRPAPAPRAARLI